jgi:hypothetical protein
MYAQASLIVMYLALALAYAAWTATWLWTRSRPRAAITVSGGPPFRGTPSPSGYDGTPARAAGDQQVNHGDTTS